MPSVRIAFMGALLVGTLFVGPASAVNTTPSYAPVPQWGGLPVLRVSCIPKCVSTLQACIGRCIPGPNGKNCRQDCAHAKQACEAKCK